MVPGTYTFNIACTGPGGPYTGTNPITITLPGTGTAIPSVPQGDTCTLTENQPTTGSWSTPTWSGTGVTGNGWSATVGPISSGATVAVNNNQKSAELVDLTIAKSTGDTVVPGTYYFNIACTGPGGPFSTMYPVQIVLPGAATYVAHVPAGDTCTVTEGQLDQAVWNTPTWSGTGVTGNGWSAQVGPINAAESVKVTNNPKGSKLVTFGIEKVGLGSFTYTFNVVCGGPGGPYTGPNPITIAFPSSSGTFTVPYLMQVPQGDTCTLTENQPASGAWNSPTWIGNGVTPSPSSGWTTTVGPINPGNSLKVTNNPKRGEPVKVPLTIGKSFASDIVPGTYNFNIVCNGPGGSQNLSTIATLPTPGLGTVQVYQGSTCTVTELAPSGSGWGVPTWSGNNVVPNGWTAQVGPINAAESVKVTNRKDIKQVKLTIGKKLAGVTSGSFSFNVSCTGTGRLLFRHGSHCAAGYGNCIRGCAPGRYVHGHGKQPGCRMAGPKLERAGNRHVRWRQRRSHEHGYDYRCLEHEEARPCFDEAADHQTVCWQCCFWLVPLQHLVQRAGRTVQQLGSHYAAGFERYRVHTGSAGRQLYRDGEQCRTYRMGHSNLVGFRRGWERLERNADRNA